MQLPQQSSKLRTRPKRRIAHRRLDPLLRNDPPRPRREEQHPVGEEQRLSQVVRDEQDGQAALHRQRTHFIVQPGARQIVECTERFVH
ncbi:MAG: hypothetical protein ACK5RK_16185 [Betaproteobacteria bacterium]